MKTTANYSTFPGIGRFAALQKSVKSIIGQVDQVRIYWNMDRFSGIPEWFHQKKIVNFVGHDMTDLGKFYPLRFVSDEYYFSCDDDLIYPDGYVKYLKAHLLSDVPVVSLHGRVINPDGDWDKSYYLGSHQVYSYLNDVDTYQDVDIVGTGVALTDTRFFKPDLLTFDYRHKMSDLLFSLEAAKQNVKMIVAPHDSAWVKPIRLEGSIHSQFHLKDQTEQIKLVKQIYNETRTKFL